MKIYLSHPYENGGVTAFTPETRKELNRRSESETNKILKLNFPDDEIIRPFKLVNPEFNRNESMKKCIELLLQCDAIFLSKDWSESKGCLFEEKVAEELGIDRIHFSDLRVLSEW